MAIDQFSLTYDTNYGIDHRTGWSVCLNGSYQAQVEPWLVVAIWKALKGWWRHER